MQYSHYQEEDFALETNRLKQRIRHGGETLEAILPSAYALVYEAVKRVLQITPYDVQLLGGLVMQDQAIAEMKTGEGKTLTAIFPLYLYSLTGKSTILVTSNAYLARRDAEEMAPVFELLGIEVGVPIPESSDDELTNDEKRREYAKDIVYTTSHDLAFDYLRDKLLKTVEERFLREFYFVLIDEIDDVLLDAAQIPLVIAGEVDRKSEYIIPCDVFAKSLTADHDFQIDKKKKSIWLTKSGQDKAELFFNLSNLYSIENHNLVKCIIQALQANYILLKNVRYTLQDEKIMLISEENGRPAKESKLSSGLHQALEAKEGLPIGGDLYSLASITYQNFYKLFPKIAGMTGTAQTSKKEFLECFGLVVKKIPTNKPSIRKDYPDRIFVSKSAKKKAIVRLVGELYHRGQPVLLVTESVKESQEYSLALMHERIPNNLLNAYSLPKEAEMISEAGSFEAVTVATSLSGRGTDIKLTSRAREVGGLAVISTTRFPSIRIDFQVRGRSGRQGDPGFSQFFLSLEDHLIRENKRAKKIYKKLINKGKEERELPQRKFLPFFVNAQKISEFKSEAIRKSIAQFDESLVIQQKIIYKKRDKILQKSCFTKEDYLVIFEEVFSQNFKNKKWILKQEVEAFIHQNLAYNAHLDWVTNKIERGILKLRLQNLFEEIYEVKKQIVTETHFNEFLRMSYLKAVDDAWLEQVNFLQEFRELLNEKSMLNKNPLHEYHKEAYRSFDILFQKISQLALQNMCLSYIKEENTSQIKIIF